MKFFKGPCCAANGIRCLISIFCTCLLAMSALGSSLPGDQHWDNQFGFVGAGGAGNRVQSVNVLGGKVYIGGTFIAAGNTSANYIAGYDGSNWSQLNNGLSGYSYNLTYVYALANDGNSLYVGGLFTNADNSGAINIARWDGSSFHPLPGGAPNSIVAAIKIAGSKFFAGGVFTSIGSTSANCVAQWTGASWQPLGTGLSGGFPYPDALALEYDGTYLYAGGHFAQAGSVSANNIARWDGTSWSAMGTGLSGTVSALCSLNGNLYAGGSFTNSSLGITNLACWNGSSWSPVGLGPDGAVQSLITDGSNLYVGGFFRNINGMAANLVAMWDGANWHALGAGIPKSLGGLGVYGMSLDSQHRLFVGGNFSQAGSVAASEVAGWDGTNWFALGATASKGMSHALGQVTGLFSDGTNVYAGGTFTEAGNQIAEQVARWDGTNWWPMGASTPGVFPNFGADTFGMDENGTLYAGGNFTNLGLNAVNHIGYWDGTSWEDIGGTDGGVEALLFDGIYLWIGGAFTNVDLAGGGGYTPGLAFYQDGTWYSEGSVSGGSQFVSALGFDTNSLNLYAGGNFTSVNSFSGPVSANNIAVYDEYTGGWTALGSGVNGTVNAILVTTNGVYVGGNFTTAGGVTVNGIAKWNANTSTWSALGSGVTYPSSFPNVNALVMIGTNLYVGGAFTNAGSVYAAGLAVWNGSTWSGLGSGLYNTPVNEEGSAAALVAKGNDLYVGGNFDLAGSKPSSFFAHWNNQFNFIPIPHPFLSGAVWLPGNQFQFRLGGTSGESYIVQASTNFIQWTPVLTNTATFFTDTNASHFPHRFYRAVMGP